MALLTETEHQRHSIVVRLATLSRKAQAERRRGYVGIHGDEYRQIHADIDWQLTRLEQHKDRLPRHLAASSGPAGE